MSESYSVILSGELVAGFERAQVKGSVAKLFKLNEQQLAKIFCGKPIALQRGISKEQAIKLQSVLVKAGALAVVKSGSQSVTR